MPPRISDGQWELIDWEPETGRTTWHYFDGQYHHYRIDTPIDEVLRENARARNDAQTGWKGDWHRVASIPSAILFGAADGFRHIAEAFENNDWKYLRRKMLNDADFRAFRTKEGDV